MSHLSKWQSRSHYQLALWLLLLFGITATCVIWLNTQHIDLSSDFSVAIIFIAYASSLAAIITATITGGTRSVKELFSQIGHWRISPKWYVLALLLPVGVVGTAHLLNLLLGGEASLPWVDLAALIAGLAAIIAGGLGEELGWRGFAQPRLQRRFSIFWASIVIGVIWATWHSWPLLASGGFEGAWLADTALTYLRLISTAIIYGWLYSVSGGSLLLVIIAHMAHNIVVTSMPMPSENSMTGVFVAILYALVATGITRRARHQLFAKV